MTSRAAAALLVAALLPPPGLAAADLAPLAERVSLATVLVEAATRSERRSGSGFFLERTGYLATALHTVEGARSIRVSIPGRYAASEARLVAASSVWDLAVLAAPWPAEAPYPGLRLDGSGALRPGTEVAVTGYGALPGEASRPLATIRGIVSGSIAHGAARSYLLDIQARPGFSGSAVYRTDTGEVSGLLNRVHAGGPGGGPGGAAPAAAIAEMLAAISGGAPAPGPP